MDTLWNLLIYSVPWYWLAAAAALVIGVPIYMIAAAIFGREVANKTIIAILGGAAVIGAAARLRQQGAADERKRIERENEKLLDEADKARDEFKKEIKDDPDSIDVDDGYRRD